MTRPLVWRDREDVSDVLGDPSFWATFGRTSRGGGGEEFFDAPVAPAAFYDSFLTKRIDAGVWPFIRVDLDEHRYVEVEFTDDHEERYWIGTRDPAWRALLGHESGHGALPAFRPAELAWLAERLPGPRRALAFLLLKATSFPAADARARDLIWMLVDALPGLRADRAQELVAECLRDQVDEDLRWTKDVELGWVSDSEHTARRWEAPLSTLTRRDHARIAAFFDGV